MDASKATLRERFLNEAESFIRAASRLEGIRRISILGSILTPKPNPKDIDLLVMVEDEADLAPLAKCARKLMGRAQSFNRTADVFLANPKGEYIGRTCPWKECGPGIRASCDALHCGRRHYLHDDLQTVHLSTELLQPPPLQVWPTIEKRSKVPADVEQFLERIKRGPAA